MELNVLAQAERGEGERTVGPVEKGRVSDGEGENGGKVESCECGLLARKKKKQPAVPDSSMYDTDHK